MFDPSAKQLDALANMERFIGIRSNRTTFANRDEFQAYWDRLDAICAKQRQKKNRAHQLSPAERQQKKAVALQKYYRQTHHLDAYARKYYLRYLPSRKRLREQLAKKCDQEDTIETVLADLKTIIDDGQTATTQRDILLGKGKNSKEVGLALRRKGYTADTINAILATDPDDDTDHLIDEEALSRRIRSLIRKGKAPRDILRTVASTPAESAAAEQALSAIQQFEAADGHNSTHTAIEKIVKKLTRQGKDHWAIKAALMRKAFDRHDIEHVLSNVENDNSNS